MGAGFADDTSAKTLLGTIMNRIIAIWDQESDDAITLWYFLSDSFDNL